VLQKFSLALVLLLPANALSLITAVYRVTPYKKVHVKRLVERILQFERLGLVSAHLDTSKF